MLWLDIIVYNKTVVVNALLLASQQITWLYNDEMFLSRARFRIQNRPTDLPQYFSRK